MGWRRSDVLTPADTGDYLERRGEPKALPSATPASSQGRSELRRGLVDLGSDGLARRGIRGGEHPKGGPRYASPRHEAMGAHL